MKIQISKEDVSEIDRVMVGTRENLIYTLKDGRYVIDSGIKTLPSPITEHIKLIPEAQAKKLIKEFEEKRIKGGYKWPNPTEIL